MQDTSDLLCIILVLLISFLIPSFCRHFKMHNVNMKSSFTSTVLTEKSSEFATQPTLTALRPLVIITFGYSDARAQMCLQAFEETRSRHWLILYSNSSPGGVTPRSQNGWVHTHLRTVVLALNKERRPENTVFPFSEEKLLQSCLSH